MNWIRFILIFPVFIILTSCETEDKEKTELTRKFRANGFNLKLTQKKTFHQLQFLLPKGFERNKFKNFTIKKNAHVYANNALGVYFSIEEFLPYDTQMEFVSDYSKDHEYEEDNEANDINTNLLNKLDLIHAAYVFKRYSSLTNGSISIKKNTSKKIPFDGLIQVVSGQSEYDERLYYATASVLINQKIWIFQFITTHEMMDYVCDDFERILTSVRLKK